ncbi:YycH family regulatory protein [Ammoniphilus sp. YIM 78166]|uniref:YycH family regulatory protein n=1 Tax=Ammoniphilus sp. YIM 78166 TaxID=1644106 RepID=UPI0014322663|nr:two-component system activity regulator YycH [Ammoniphilus sp. YIM 78166]
MWDKGKTILLNFLVLTSLILTWLLVNSQPKYEYLHPAEYVEPLPVGEKKELRQLVKPQSMVLHYGNDRYTGVVMDSIHYRLILKEMEKWYFYNFNLIEMPDASWDEVVRNKKAIEIIYPTDISMEMMAEIFTFRGKVNTMLPSAKRIMIYVDDSEKEAYALLTDTEGKRILQARTAITPRDLDQFYLSLGNSLTELMIVPASNKGQRGHIYLPTSELTLKEFRYFYQPIPIAQMLQTLFVDPSITRQVTERNGTTIYTDGSKAVQIPPGNSLIHFYDPLTEMVSSPSKEGHYHSVINFINEHGGWNGTYLLEDLKNLPHQQEKTYLFRQYVGAYPVYSGNKESFGEIEVISNQSYIVEYHRSLLNLDTYFDHQDVAVMSGKEVLERIAELGYSLEEIEDIYLGYEARTNDHHLMLTAKWMVKMEGKPLVMIDARSVKKEEADGLEKGENITDPSIPASR